MYVPQGMYTVTHWRPKKKWELLFICLYLENGSYQSKVVICSLSASWDLLLWICAQVSGSTEYIKLKLESFQYLIMWRWLSGSPVILWQIMNSQRPRRVVYFSFMKSKCAVFTDVPGITCLSAAYCSRSLKKQKPKHVQSTRWLQRWKFNNNWENNSLF